MAISTSAHAEVGRAGQSGVVVKNSEVFRSVDRESAPIEDGMSLVGIPLIGLLAGIAAITTVIIVATDS